MTEKRFYMDKSGDLWDKKGDKLIVDFGYSLNWADCKWIIDLLNELHNENQMLKRQYADDCNKANSLTVKIAELMEEKKQLKLQYSELEITLMNNQLAYNDLKEENEQLKIDLGIAEDNRKLDKEIIDDIHNEFQKVKKENEQLKQLLREVEHELTSLTGLSCFDKCASQLGYVEVFDKDMWELDYTKLLAKIEKELQE